MVQKNIEIRLKKNNRGPKFFQPGPPNSLIRPCGRGVKIWLKDSCKDDPLRQLRASKIQCENIIVKKLIAETSKSMPNSTVHYVLAKFISTLLSPMGYSQEQFGPFFGKSLESLAQIQTGLPCVTFFYVNKYDLKHQGNLLL